MRRGKPQQEIYKPGSGRLRRSTHGGEDSVNEGVRTSEEVQSNLENSSNRDMQRKSKKPERELYIPRPVAQAREHLSPQTVPQEPSGVVNGGKRYSNNRGRGERNNGQSEWREKSPNRNYRMGSEPRNGPINSGSSGGQNWNHHDRHRDTKSVEPSGHNYRNNGTNSGKIQSKPPSGRRHSTVGGYPYEQERLMNVLKTLDNLPPRLKKKYMEDNGITPELLEEAGALRHQGSNVYSTLPHSTAPPNYTHNSHLNAGYHTLPSRPRGRGRYHHPEPEFQPGPAFRSLTPDRGAGFPRSPLSSRPGTPTRRFENRPPSRPSSRSQTPVGYLDDNRYSSDAWGDRADRSGGKPNVFDRLGGSFRAHEHRHLDNRDRDRQNNRRDQARRGDGERERGNHHRKSDKRRKGGRDRRSTSPEYSRQEFGKSDVKNGSNSTLTEIIQPHVKISEVAPQTDPIELETEQKIEEVKVNYVDDLKISNWAEEVEREQEAEAFSDAMTRSSSMASLQEVSHKSMPPPNVSTNRKKKKGSRRKSKQRSDSNYRDKTPTNRNRKDSFASVESHENFRGQSHGGRRRRSRDNREPSFDRFRNRSRGSTSRDVSFERNQSHQSVAANWREEIIRSRQNSEREGSTFGQRMSSDRSRKNSERDDHLIEPTAPTKKGGLLILPTNHRERPKFPDVSRQQPQQQKILFDPKNPDKPILVKSPGGRVATPGTSESNLEGPKIPNWYNEESDAFKTNPEMFADIKRADTELQYIINNALLLVNYERVDLLRDFLKKSLEYLLRTSIKFCQAENVEQHIWKLVYYNIIEVTRKTITDDPSRRDQYKSFLLYLIDEGTKYFESLVDLLENEYDFKVANFLGNNNRGYQQQQHHRGSTRMALVSAQKLFLFLGDLERYREQVNETTNYGKCRQWYMKSHEINPKNGKPYNQLAILAMYSRRKLDAVYYYMRSLMSSNPVPSAHEKLICLFDDNRKKYLQQIYYEQGEKKRREERLERQKRHMKQKESEEANSAQNFLRKEIWVRPDSGRRLHRTTKALQKEDRDSEEEDLASLSSVDVNKRFVTSYLHVHGKLITKIGMESFQDAAVQMLKEFRALLQHSPVSLNCNRFLQLLALNMFAIEKTQLKDLNLQQSAGYRSELQERALIVSLQMFNLILERCLSILQDHVNAFHAQQKSGSPLDSLPYDANVLLPAIKVWCDWMSCHTAIWNPPPSTNDYKVGPSSDLWSRLGRLMGIFERMGVDFAESFVDTPQEDYEMVRLPEDVTLCGFTPLICVDGASFAPRTLDPEVAQLRLRISKLFFFGTVFLCGLEPPVLKLEIEDNQRGYVSVVRTDRGSGRESPVNRENEALFRNQGKNDEVLLETFSDDDMDELAKKLNEVEDASSEVKDLLSRKLELEQRSRTQYLHQQQVKKILSQSVVSVQLEIRPKYLVPDTNCFIDHLDSIQVVAKSQSYTLMVPIVVLSELEGLSKGTPPPSTSARSATPSPDHVRRVAAACRSALEFLKKRHASVKCVTTKGAVLASTSFSTEDDSTWDITMKNDDKILTTCLVLCKGHGKEPLTTNKEGEPPYLFREVVLLTEDRNLRVKAHARDMPVCALPKFMGWAGLGG